VVVGAVLVAAIVIGTLIVKADKNDTMGGDQE